ncbi:MAG: PSD1 and planctomycete cytochrome C domain-containing protein, partial [Saprospiraceae bacterium]|nr:PSD1 and planctomycete cytochrome C domain-containing protein [Saprospiraceae bacterium]
KYSVNSMEITNDMKTLLPSSAMAYFLVGFLFYGCTYGPGEDADYSYATLETEALLTGWKEVLDHQDLSEDQQDRLNLHVRAIFAHRCFQCHSTAKHKGALILDSKEGVFEGGDGGPIIVSGDSEASEIIRRVGLRRNHDDAMPPEGGGLTKSEIETIALWIDQGAYWTNEELKIFREADLALNMPNGEHLDPAFTNPIDQWVDQYFKENHIKWPDPIDDRRYIRRAYLDVVGLLPSIEDIEEFVNDSDGQKRDQLIDRLLADRPNYTIHWMSFWNDLLRNDYSGTGFITNGRKQISSWLYQALYDNLSYDSLVYQLINPTEDSEGFIQGIKWRGVVNASQSTELQAAQNISQSLLGVNLKCASCHNSFINNVTLQQAYDFAQIFVDSTIELYRCDKPTGRFAKPAFLYPELGEVVGDSLSDRLASLANIIVQPANGRLYRTVVNRYWDRLFGRGMVAPVDEMDNPPWSQQLLDWLASHFHKSGTDLNQLIKTIMTSRTYQLPVASYADPNDIQTPRFIFRGPVARRLTAEQTADAFSSLFTPLYYSVAFDPEHIKLPAWWIWHRQIEFDRTVLPYPGKRYFRKKFSTSNESIVDAEMMISVDHSYSIYLNNIKIGRGEDWRKVNRYKVGNNIGARNIIAIEANNDGEIPNPAGILFAMKIYYENGDIDSIFSDDSWTTYDSMPDQNWKKYDYQDDHWQEAWKAGSFTGSHWGRLLDFSFEKTDNSMMARAALVKLDPFLRGLGRPVRENVATRRDDEPTLLQSLLLSNDQFLAAAIASGASRWFQKYSGDTEETVDLLFSAALGRAPSTKERRILMARFNEKMSQEAIEDLIWSILLLPEFQFI